MKKKMVLGFILMGVVVFSAYSQQYNAESDFSFEITITEYKGTKTDVRIPPQIQNRPVTVIGAGAFSPYHGGSKQLTSISIPNSVREISGSAFAGNKLTNISLPEDVAVIGYGAFRDNQLTSVNIPQGVYEIGQEAFANNKLTSVTIPGGFASTFMTIRGFAFMGNNQLTTITIEDYVILDHSGVPQINAKPYCFENGFDDFYERNGRKAGTYTYANGKWTRR